MTSAGDLIDGFVDVLGPFCGWKRFRCLLDMLVAGEAELLLVAGAGDLIQVGIVGIVGPLLELLEIVALVAERRKFCISPKKGGSAWAVAGVAEWNEGRRF